MSFTVDVIVHVPPAELMRRWERALADWGMTGQFDPVAVAEIRSSGTWAGALPVACTFQAAPGIPAQPRLEGRRALIGFECGFDSTDRVTAESLGAPPDIASRLSGSHYVVSLSTGAGRSAAEWRGLWLSAGALAQAANGILFNTESGRWHTGSGIREEVGQNIAAFEGDPAAHFGVTPFTDWQSAAPIQPAPAPQPTAPQPLSRRERLIYWAVAAVFAYTAVMILFIDLSRVARSIWLLPPNVMQPVIAVVCAAIAFYVGRAAYRGRRL